MLLFKIVEIWINSVSRSRAMTHFFNWKEKTIWCTVYKSRQIFGARSNKATVLCWKVLLQEYFSFLLKGFSNQWNMNTAVLISKHDETKKMKQVINSFFETKAIGWCQLNSFYKKKFKKELRIIKQEIVFEDVKAKGKYLKLAHNYLLSYLQTIRARKSFLQKLENFSWKWLCDLKMTSCFF